MAEEIKVTVVFATAGAKRNVKQFTGELKEMEDQTKKTSKNASGSFANLRSSAARNLGKAGLAGIAVAASGAVVMGYNRMQEKGKEFETSLADLSAITGISGDALDQLAEKALDDSVKYGEAANNIIEANKLVASQLASKIDFNTDEGLRELQEVSEQAVVLQKAAGVDLPTAVRTLTTAVNQFNLPASETSRIIDSIAAGSKFGAAEVADQAEAYREAGSVAASANLSFEELNASTQVLAENAIRGSQAGTQQRNVFLTLNNSAKLAEAGIKGVNLQNDGLAVTLNKLKPLLRDSAALEKLFGREAITAAQLLIKNADAVGEMTEKVSQRGIAQEQLNVKLQTAEVAEQRFANAIDSVLIPAFRENNGVMVSGLNTLTEWVVQTGYAISVINDFFDAHSRLRDEISQGDDEITKYLSSMREVRNALAEAAISGELNADQQAELEQSYKRVNEYIRDKASALYDETFAMKQEKAALEESVDALQGYEEAVARNEIDRLTLQIEANEKTINRLTKELEAGKISWQEYVDQYLKAQDAFMRGPGVENIIPDDEIISPELQMDLPDSFDPGPIDLYGDAIKSLTDDVRNYMEVSSVLGDHTNDINYAMQRTGETIDQLIRDGYSALSPEVQELKEQYEELKNAQQAQHVFMQTMGSDQIKTLADIGNAIRDQVQQAIKARIAQAVATQVAKIISSVPFPLNIALAAGAGATVSALFNQIPSFRKGVDDYEGGLAKVHKNEVITYLPKGSNVITNKNVQAMERINRQPFIPDAGRGGSVMVQPADNSDILAAIQDQTNRMEHMERRVEFNMSEFNRKYTRWKMKEEGLG